MMVKCYHVIIEESGVLCNSLFINIEFTSSSSFNKDMIFAYLYTDLDF